jgi:hypothetical protein
MRVILPIPLIIALSAGVPPTVTKAQTQDISGQNSSASGAADAAAGVSPEEKMRKRFPQPVRVGDLIGLRVLDENDVTIGFVRQVVRTRQDKILLIVAYGGWFGWGSRLVAVPIEVVAIFGRQLAALDMPPKEFEATPTWSGAGAEPIPNDETIRIALTRR